MNPEDISDILDEIGERIGPMGSAAWEILVQGTFAVSLVGTIAGILLLIGGIVAAQRLHKYGRTLIRQDYKNVEQLTDSGIGTLVGAWFVGVFVPIIGVLVTTHNLVGVLAPEFRVLENILATIKGGS